MKTPDLYDLSAYDYYLPENLIAQYPCEKRDHSRLLFLNKDSGEIKHHTFYEIINYLIPGDVLVFNVTKVFCARLFGKKMMTGGKVEVLLLHEINEGSWECLVKPGHRVLPGTNIEFPDGLSAEIVDFAQEGGRIITFNKKGKELHSLIEKIGKMPLPPYIDRESTDNDKETYQTVYAQEEGSIAAPTAGLHFTNELIEKIIDKGVEIREVVLHVGIGTFRPVHVDKITEHKMHKEFCSISEETAKALNSAKNEGRRIIAVGTTSTRTLESMWRNGQIISGEKWTDLFIFPGRELHVIDGLITNFHMPKSTLLMLISAFAGYENIFNAYSEAIRHNYKFFSYGDGMLIL